jgi:ribosomal protein S2
MRSQFITRYNPNRDLKSPVKPRNVTIEQLLAAGCHIGHNKSSCHPSMKPFISGLYDRTSIINLDYTIAHLRRACTVIRDISFRHGTILFIGTRKGHKPILVSATERMHGYMIFRKWIPGTVTNGGDVLKRGYLKDELTPFWQYANPSIKLEGRPPPWKTEKTMYRYNIKDQEWESPLDSDNNEWGRPYPSDIKKVFKDQAREEWMAWEKFASIAQDVSDVFSDVITLAKKSLNKITSPALSVESVAQYIPDHRVEWLEGQMKSEIEEYDRRRALSYQTGDRSPIEMHAMHKFLARKKYPGTARGTYIASLPERLEAFGLSAYPTVKRFMDGSSMVGNQRYDISGERINRNADGSFVIGNDLYGPDGMRYDVENKALVFADGSQLKFENGELIVVIKEKAFEVTSMVVGSARKREILKKFEEFMESEPGLSESANDSEDYRDNLQNPLTERELKLASDVLGASLSDLLYSPENSNETKAVEEDQEDEDDDPDGTDKFLGRLSEREINELPGLKISKALELLEDDDAKEMDELIATSTNLSELEEDTFGAEEPDISLAASTFARTSSIPTVKPDLIVILNPRENRIALREAMKNQIPTIGIIDTDCDPRLPTYSIPANDDSLRSVEYIVGVLSRAGEEGLIHRNRYAELLSLLKTRAEYLLEDAWNDYNILEHNFEELASEDYTIDAMAKAVIEKYSRMYELDPERADLLSVSKIVGHHVVAAQNELQRLHADTTGWTMGGFLHQVQTSSQFPQIPRGALEEIAKVQMTNARHAWAEARENVDLRSDKLKHLNLR